MGATSSSIEDGEGVHYRRPTWLQSAPYPPPTYIDFTTGDLCPPFPPTLPVALVIHCQWLGGPHDGYPLAKTLDEYVLHRLPSDGPRGTLAFAALRQSQLTFGLLEAVLRIKIPESFLLASAADGTTTLSTANLPTLCRDLFHRFEVRHHRNQCHSWQEEVAATITKANKRLRAYRKQKTNPFVAAGLHQEASEDIFRALCMIGASLNLILLQSPTICKANQTIPLLTFDQLPDTKPADVQLRAQGWCPLIIAALKEYNFVVLEYAKSFPPFLRKPEEHSRCTETVCTVNNIDPTTYFQRHFPEECTCAPVIPPVHRVKSLLSGKRIPVVTLSDKELTVYAAEDGPYIAISHVWADGLGSTTEEGLPACQVERIASMTSSLVHGGAFWIDGLCVPEEKDLRKQAIRLMAKTYTDAAAVLVIDAGIRSCSKHAPMEEKLLRIRTSGWMHRLWTYQEAMLAKKLWFEFADGLVDFEDLLPSRPEIYAGPLLLFLCDTLHDIHNYIKGHLEGYYPPIHLIAHAVQWRTTSRIEDETLALAGLLPDIDVHELLEISSSEERMASLLLQKRTFNPGIIFVTAPKISGLPWFSWAPRSFITGPHPGVWAGEESAICTPTGLLAEYESFVFSERAELDEDTRYIIRDTTGPACSFLRLLRPVVLVRDTRRKICNAILFDQEKSNFPGNLWNCVGVMMFDTEEGTLSSEREQVCMYREIHFSPNVINDPELSRQQASGTRVIDGKWFPRMKVRVG